MSDPYKDMADDVKKIHDNIEAMKEQLGRDTDSDRGEERQEKEDEGGQDEEKASGETQENSDHKELEEKLEKTRKSAEDLWDTVEGTESTYPGFRQRGGDEEGPEDDVSSAEDRAEETEEKPANSDEQEFRENIEQALEYAEKGDYREARREYQWLSQRFRALKAKGKIGDREAQLLEKLRDRVDRAKTG